MAVQKTKNHSLSPEQEALELFEVGANEEVLEIAERHPSVFLNHLGFLAEYELKGQTTEKSLPGISKLSPLVEALQSFQRGRTREAANQIGLYFQSSHPEITYSIVHLSLKVFQRSENYRDMLHVIGLYKSKYDSHSFAKEEIIALYSLREYEELVKVYKKNSKLLNDPEIHKLIGMALLFLNRPKEAGLILESIPGKMNLPSFEEKKQSYERIYSKIGQLEAKKQDLSMKELEDMGFAYLFHGEYEKAENLFTSLTLKLKSSLCTV